MQCTRDGASWQVMPRLALLYYFCLLKDGFGKNDMRVLFTLSAQLV
jgi:hypothetical protein